MPEIPLAERLADARARLDAGAALDYADLSLLLGVSKKSLARMVEAGTIPAPDLCFNKRVLRWSAKLVRPIVDGGTLPEGAAR
jgi:hypothetical protein